MNIKFNKTNLEYSKAVIWEDHKKYDGSVYLNSTAGASYVGFILKGTDNVAIYYSPLFGSRKFKGILAIEGINPKLIPHNTLIKSAIMGKFGIDVDAEIKDDSIIISNIKCIQSANTLFRALRYLKIRMESHETNFTISIPLATSQKLLIA